MFDRTHLVHGSVRRLWPLVAAVPLGALAGGGYALVATPQYTANSYVVVVPDSAAEATAAVNFAQAYGRLAGQPQVLALAAGDAGHTPAELTNLVSATTSPDAPVIEIDGTGSRPTEAVRTADAVARALIGFGNGTSRDTGVRLVSLAPAAAPDKPTSPTGALDVAVGAAAGVLLGSLALMVRRRPADDAPAPEPAAAVPAPASELAALPAPAPETTVLPASELAALPAPAPGTTSLPASELAALPAPAPETAVVPAPAKEQPFKDQPAKEQPFKEQPFKDQPVKQQSAKDQPANGQPATGQTVKGERPVNRPQPAAAEPARQQPGAVKSAVRQPGRHAGRPSAKEAKAGARAAGPAVQRDEPARREDGPATRPEEPAGRTP
jgi:capsular polysaccharide biosynthesis protein